MSARFNFDMSKAVDVDWVSSQELWNTYKLEDGSTLKLRIVLKGVKRAFEKSPTGEPMYLTNVDFVTRVVDVPKELLSLPSQPMKPT
jgi:hypothetical protein